MYSIGEFRPALKIAECFETLFALAQRANWTREGHAFPAAASAVWTGIREGNAAALASLADPASSPCAVRTFGPTPRFAAQLQLRADREESGHYESTCRIEVASFLEDCGAA